MTRKLPAWPLAEKPNGALTVLRKPRATEADRTSGRVQKLDYTKNFGFARAAMIDGDARDYFFHRKAVEPEDWNALAVGDLVSFIPEMTARGPRALKVRKEGA